MAYSNSELAMLPLTIRKLKLLISTTSRIRPIEGSNVGRTGGEEIESLFSHSL